jgi:hypothetical protein
MNTKMVKILRGVMSIVTLMLVSISTLDAQCAMCKAGLHSNLAAGGNQGIGMNAGIFMLMIMPYVLVGGIAYVWYRNRKRGVDEGETVELREIGV